MPPPRPPRPPRPWPAVAEGEGGTNCCESTSACARDCACRCANSSSVSVARSPNSAGRCSGALTFPGHMPCRSGSPHDVRGAEYGRAEGATLPGAEADWVLTTAVLIVTNAISARFRRCKRCNCTDRCPVAPTGVPSLHRPASEVIAPTIKCQKSTFAASARISSRYIGSDQPAFSSSPRRFSTMLV